jgi:Co/Zn/Cd efflux system component
MEKLLEQLVQYGALGIVAAVSLWQAWRVQKELVGLVKENTKATIENVEVMKQLKETIRDCQTVHNHHRITDRGRV